MEHLLLIVVAMEASPDAHTIPELTEAAEAVGVDLGDGLKADKIAAARVALDAAAAALEAETAAADAKEAAAIAETEAAAAASLDAAQKDAEAAAVIIIVDPDDPAMLSALLSMLGIVGKPAGSVLTCLELRDGVRAAWRTFAPLLTDVLKAGHVPPVAAAPVMPPPPAAVNAEASLEAMRTSGIPVLVPKPPGGEVVTLPQPAKTGVFPIHQNAPPPTDIPAGVFANGMPVLTPGSTPQAHKRGDGRAHRVVSDRLPILKPDGA